MARSSPKAEVTSSNLVGRAMSIQPQRSTLMQAEIYALLRR
jgi:hypothetical protein